MDRTAQEGPAIPTFISKLWDLVDSGKHADLIGWSAGGRSVVIHNTHRFAKDLLPLYFKHNHMDSFTRQLNTYGFRNGVEDAGVKRKYGETVFRHPHFLMGQADLLTSIKRKTPDKSSTVSPADQLAFKLNDEQDILAQVIERQDALDDFMMEMEKENSAVWREILMLRHRSAKQKAIAQQIIQFLVPKKRNKSRKRSGSLIHTDLPNAKQVRAATFECDHHPDVVRFSNKVTKNNSGMFNDSINGSASQTANYAGLSISDARTSLTNKSTTVSPGTDCPLESEDVSLYQKELSEFVHDTSSLFGSVCPSDGVPQLFSSSESQIGKEVDDVVMDVWQDELICPHFDSSDLLVVQNNLMFPVHSCPSPVAPDSSMFDFCLSNA